MPQFDLDVPSLHEYRPNLREPDDLDRFWADTLAASRSHDLGVDVTPVESPLALVDSYDVTFRGFGGQPVRAWLHRPAGSRDELPLVVQYPGYSRGRGHVFENLDWVLAGYAHLVVDVRGQGWGGSVAATPDDDPEAGLIAAPGVLTRGILSPETYYYRRVYTDAVRAVDAARALPGVDPSRIVLAGTSQGGGIAIAVAALSAEPIAAMVNVPFLCHFERAVTITDNDPYQEIAVYLRRYPEETERVFGTLRYFDGAILATRARIPALFSVALMDQTCPPSTVFAAYNRWEHPDRSIEVYPFNRHEGGQLGQLALQYDWMQRRLA